MTKSAEIEKLVDTILKKIYAKKPSKIVKHAKKIKKIRKKKKNNKKLALHNQFKYAAKLLQHNQKKLGLPTTSVYGNRRRANLRRMNAPRVQRMYQNTRPRKPYDYDDFKNIYRNLHELDWEEKQQKEYAMYNNQHKIMQTYAAFE